MTSIVVSGGDRWLREQAPEDRPRMEHYVERVKDCSGRCATCAFRTGTDANRSRLVLYLVEMCMMREDTFMCHTGLAADETPHRPCAGFVALRDSLAGQFAAAPSEGMDNG